MKSNIEIKFVIFKYLDSEDAEIQKKQYIVGPSDYTDHIKYACHFNNRPAAENALTFVEDTGIFGIETIIIKS